MGRVASKTEQVRGIRQWRDGAPMWLYERGRSDSPVRVLCLGKGPDCELQAIPDPTIEDAPEIGDVHCTLVCTADRVMVSGIAEVGPTWVNEIHVLSGQVEVRPGNVITVGSAQLVVFGDNPLQPPDITAPDIPTLIAKTKELFEGGTSKKVAGKVADALRVPRRTYLNWLRSGRFMTVATVCLGLGYWGLSGSSNADGPRNAAPAAAATAVSPALDTTVESATSPTVDDERESEATSKESPDGDDDTAKRLAHDKLKVRKRAAKRTQDPRRERGREASTSDGPMDPATTGEAAETATTPLVPRDQDSDVLREDREASGGTIVFERDKPAGGTLVFGSRERGLETMGETQ